jgi:hypothetical protein
VTRQYTMASINGSRRSPIKSLKIRPAAYFSPSLSGTLQRRCLWIESSAAVPELGCVHTN